MLLKSVHIFSVLLVLNYCFLPVYSLKPCKTATCCCCCNHSSTTASNCECAVGQSNEKQPISTSETTTISFQTRMLCSPEKSYFPLYLDNIRLQSNKSPFPGQNNFNISQTITRLTIPLRIWDPSALQADYLKYSIIRPVATCILKYMTIISVIPF